MPKPKRQKESFGQRLTRIRKARGLSQSDLGRRLGISQRVVAYYEGQTQHPPSHLLPSLARVLAVSTDELLGVTPVRTEPLTIDVRLLRRLERIQRLPPASRRAVLKVIDDLIRSRGGHDGDDDGAPTP